MRSTQIMTETIIVLKEELKMISQIFHQVLRKEGENADSRGDFRAAKIAKEALPESLRRWRVE